MESKNKSCCFFLGSLEVSAVFFRVFCQYCAEPCALSPQMFLCHGKAVRKMTLSDPWMEGDDFQPGSHLNSCGD